MTFAKLTFLVVEPLEPRTLLAGSGLAGAYFNSTNLTNKDFARIDAQVNFAASTSPTNTSSYSVRWSGRIEPKFTETYHFSTVTSGGVRLWINNQLVIDKWSIHSLRTDAANIALKAGQRYDIRMEYLSNGSSSTARLYWQNSRLPKELVPANRLYAPALESKAPTAPGKPQGFYTTDTTLRFKWSASSDPSGTIYYDVFEGSSKVGTTTGTSFTRAGRTPGKAYKYTVKAMDVFGNLATSKTLSMTTLPAAAPGAGTGFAASYFSGTSFDQFRMTRTDAELHFNFASPPVTTPTGTYSVRWEGQLVPKYSETYTLYLTSDDGARLWVNDQLLIDHWTAHQATEDRATISLVAGQQYEVRVEYFQSGGAASAHLEWSSLSQARQMVPASQVLPEFVDRAAPSTPSGLAAADVGADTVSLNWSASSDDVGVAGYDVYRGSTKVASTTSTTFSDTGLSASTTYQYSVRAVDGASHVSAASTNLAVTTDAPPAGHNAFNTISAGNFDGSSGVTKSGSNAVDFDNGDWIRFNNVNFSSGANSVRINIALPTSNTGGALEFRLDSPSGPLIGSLATQPTGSFNTYFTKQAQITGASGVRSLYVVGRNRSDLANVQSLVFRTQSLTRVMTLGDSVTQQFVGNTTWRYRLWRRLLDAGKNVDFVGPFQQNTNGWPGNLDFDLDHASQSGIRTDQVLAQVSGWANSARPDVVLIHLGTNDLRANQSPASTINELSQIIDVLRSVNPNVKVLLATIIPVGGGEVPAGSVDDFNDRIPTLASQKRTGQSPVILVDQFSGFSLNTDSDDNLHPNDNGEQKMSNKWFEELAPIVA